MVASNKCKNENCSPLYKLPSSPTSKRAYEFSPFSVLGNDDPYSGWIVKDRVCLDLEESCVENVGFLAMGNDWKFYNMLGLAPRSETSGPVLIQRMKQYNIISEEIATL